MTDIKISELTATTVPLTTDIVPIVTDPSGTPATKKVAVKDLLNTRRLYSIVPSGNFALGTGTSAQAALPSTGDVFTVESATTYFFEGKYYITKSGTTCTIALSFVLGGGASVTSIHYVTNASNIAADTTTPTVASAWIDTVSATVVNATATTAAFIEFSGLIRVNAGGTITPSITFSAAPTSPVMVADSYVLFTKSGTSTENTLGAVA